MDKIEREAYRRYQAGGQTAVYKYAREIGVKDWSACEPCDDETPTYSGCCLVCSTEKRAVRA